MPTALTIYANVDTQDQPLNTSGVEWVEIDGANDFIVISNGSVGVVEDGQVVPGQDELNQAGFVLSGIQITADKYFVADISADELKQINNMGNQNKRYVLAFDFDGPTASEPRLELWDDVTLSTVNNISLGEGTPNNSWFRGITTTAGLPGINWTGSRLAGATAGNFLYLNNQAGPLGAAGTLYAQLKLIIPATADTSGAETPVAVVKYTTN